MNSSSLAQFIGPHLLRPAPSDQAQQIELANADKVSYVMQVMIDQYTAVFRVRILRYGGIHSSELTVFGFRL